MSALQAAKASLPGFIPSAIICMLGFDECDTDPSLEMDKNYNTFGDTDLHFIALGAGLLATCMAAAPWGWAVPLSAITASALASARCRLDGLGGGGLVCPPFCAAVSRARLGEGTDLLTGVPVSTSCFQHAYSCWAGSASVVPASAPSFCSRSLASARWFSLRSDALSVCMPTAAVANSAAAAHASGWCSFHERMYFANLSALRRWREVRRSDGLISPLCALAKRASIVAFDDASCAPPLFC